MNRSLDATLGLHVHVYSKSTDNIHLIMSHILRDEGERIRDAPFHFQGARKFSEKKIPLTIWLKQIAQLGGENKIILCLWANFV